MERQQKEEESSDDDDSGVCVNVSVSLALNLPPALLLELGVALDLANK